MRKGFWSSNILNRFYNISHGFLSNPYSFNLSFNIKNIISAIKLYNYTKISFRNWVLTKQIHSDEFYFVKEDKKLFFPQIVSNIDSVITLERKRVLIMFFADCFPIFIYSPKIPLVGIIHAGWRGVFKKFPFKVVKNLLDTFNILSKDIYLAIGPGIQKCCFEVSYEFVINLHEDDKKFLILKGQRFYYDLQENILSQLLALDIPRENIDIAKICTKCNPNFYSYRRDKTSERNIGFIYLK
jgi:YfiH family protein